MKLIRVVLAGCLVFAVSATALEKHDRDRDDDSRHDNGRHEGWDHRDHRRESLGVVAPYLDRERALAGRGEHLLEVEKLSGTFRPTEPRKPGGR